MTDDPIPYEDPEEPDLVEGMFTDLAEAKIIPPKWVIRDMLPVGLTFLVGPAKDSQKSTLALGLSLLVSGHKVEILPKHMSKVERFGTVASFSSEALAGELKDMAVNGLHVELSNKCIYVADDPGEFRLDDPDGQNRLKAWFEHLKPQMVIVDVLRDFHELEEKDSTGMNLMLRWLRDWAKVEEAAVLIVHHVRKLGEGRSEYGTDDVRGSSAIFGLADGLILIHPKDGWKHIRAWFKRAKGWERTIKFGAYGEKAEELLDELDQKVLDAIEAGCPTLEDIAKQCHVAKQVVVDACARLERNGMIARKGRGYGK